MEKIYYFGDLCYIFDDDTWQQIANQFLRQTDDNDKFVFKKDGKEIALYMNSTQNSYIPLCPKNRPRLLKAS